MVRNAQGVVLTPANEQVGGAEVKLLPDSRGINKVEGGAYKLNGNRNNPFTDFGLRLDLSGSEYGFRSGESDSSVSITVNAIKVSNERDLLFAVQFPGQKYLTLGTDLDGYIMTGGNPNIESPFVYPSCGSSLPTGDAKNLIKGTPGSGANFYTFRDVLGGGNRNNLKKITGAPSGRGATSTSITLEFINDDINNKLTLKLSSTRFNPPLSCVYNGAVGTDKPMNVFITVDVDEETTKIPSIEVKGRNVGDPCNGVVCPDDNNACNGVNQCVNGKCILSPQVNCDKFGEKCDKYTGQCVPDCDQFDIDSFTNVCSNNGGGSSARSIFRDNEYYNNKYNPANNGQNQFELLQFSTTELLLFLMNILTAIIGLFICWKGGLFENKKRTVRYAKIARIDSEAEALQA